MKSINKILGMEISEKVKLYNRYGDEVNIEFIGKNEFVLNSPLIGGEDSCQASYEKLPNGEIKYYSVDPSGGPFITLGWNRLMMPSHETIDMFVENISRRDGKWVLNISKLEYDFK